jgi:hypothetical protein
METSHLPPPSPSPSPANTSVPAPVDEPNEDLDYINRRINPVLSRLMIRIINEDPVDVVDFMIQFLKKEE